MAACLVPFRFHRASTRASICTARYCFAMSVRQSVRLSIADSVSKRMHVLTIWSGHRYSFWSVTKYQVWNSVSGGFKYTGAGKFAVCDFRLNRRLSEKRYKIGPWLLWIEVIGGQLIRVGSDDFEWPWREGSNFSGESLHVGRMLVPLDIERPNSARWASF